MCLSGVYEPLKMSVSCVLWVAALIPHCCRMVPHVWAAVLPWESGVGCGKDLFRAGWLL